MTTIIFDIETGPLSTEQVESVMPAFDPAEIKTGNLKDPAKVAEKIEQVRASHRQSVIDRAALDPMTGQVLAIGVMTTEDDMATISGAEADVLNAFWDMIRTNSGIHRLFGYNCRDFDVPFICRRSFVHGIPVPPNVWDGRWTDKNIIDLSDWWRKPRGQGIYSLAQVCRMLGLGEKAGDGKDFANLWATDREQAVAYLKQDLELTRKLAQRMGQI